MLLMLRTLYPHVQNARTRALHEFVEIMLHRRMIHFALMER